MSTILKKDRTAQYEKIAHCLPVNRGNVKLSNLQVLNAILYVLEHGCKWRSLPAHLGNWHTVYTRMSRWSKAGVLERVFAQLQRSQIARIRIDVVCLDRTSVKMHPDGSGDVKKSGPQAIGKSRGGRNTKTHLAAANERTALRFSLSPDQAHDAPQGRTLLKQLRPTERAVHLTHEPRLRRQRDPRTGRNAGVYSGRATKPKAP